MPESAKHIQCTHTPHSKTPMPKSEKRNGSSSFSKRTRLRASSEFTSKALIAINDPRSKTVKTRKRKTQRIFFVLKA